MYSFYSVSVFKNDSQFLQKLQKGLTDQLSTLIDGLVFGQFFSGPVSLGRHFGFGRRSFSRLLVGVRSRKEVLSKLFFEHYVPRHRDASVPSPYGWFLEG